VSKAQLNALYVQRWHVELDLRSIKSVMGMDILRCKSPDMVHKEVSAFFLAYNFRAPDMGGRIYATGGALAHYNVIFRVTAGV
jgi:hypothetical protein